jgi:hypothetical protein
LKCAAVAWNLKDLTPATECDLFKFATAADLIQWEVYSDAENGGMTTASFQSNGNLGTGKLFCNILASLPMTTQQLKHESQFLFLESEFP